MNKTASLIIRVIAIVAAGAAGGAWYMIHSQNLEVAMNKSEWMTRDNEISAGKEFVQRMNALDKVDQLLKDKRTQITDLTAQKQGLEETVTSRNKTIDSLKSDVSTLESERAALVRTRDDLKAQVQEASSKVAQVQGELDKATADLARKNEQIAGMYSKEQFDEQTALVAKSEDAQQKAFATYARLRTWTVAQGFTPPFPANPSDESVDATGNALAIKETPAEIKTQIVTVDRRNGLMGILLGVDNHVRPGQVFNVKSNGADVGQIRLTEVRDGLSVAAIMPGSQHQLLVKEAVITLTRPEPVAVAP